MRVVRNSKGSRARLAGEAARAVPLPDDTEVEVVAGADEVAQVPKSPPPKTVTLRALKQGLCSSWSECLQDLSNPANRAQFLHIKAQMNSIERLALGFEDGMAAVAHPFDTQGVVPSANAVIHGFPVLRRVAPLSVQGLDPEQMALDRDSLEFLYKVQGIEGAHVDGIEVLVSNSEQVLDAQAKQVYERLDPSVYLLPDASRSLPPLRTHFTGAAQAAVQSRKDNAKATQKGKDEVLAQTPPSEPARPAGPVTSVTIEPATATPTPPPAPGAPHPPHTSGPRPKNRGH